ncbi:MAG: class I SAM-dependent methyltransferase [Gammaproteobacteria bacterium]|nr:class I SAM-dependent methyltransferase [Gammaproteobacteria bacterium]
MLQKWITSMTAFASIIFPVLEAIKPHRIGEIGAAEGGNTQLLYQFVEKHNGTLITIDPSPRGTFLQWVASCSNHVQHIPECSFNAIPQAGDVDVWFVDGDHNWYTVYHELLLIHELAKQHQKPLMIFMHDVGWPCGRRDMYYDPSRIPAEYLQPYAPAEQGITLQSPVPITGFLKGPCWALQEGGPKNGVLTAVEDFLKTTANEYEWIFIPAILGLGILIDKTHPAAKEVIQFYAAFHHNPVMALMENDRINHYIASTALQHKISMIAD